MGSDVGILKVSVVLCWQHISEVLLSKKLRAHRKFFWISLKVSDSSYITPVDSRFLRGSRMVNRFINFVTIPGNIKGPIIWAGFLIGTVFSILSATNLCAESCSDAHKYTFLGVPLAFFGIGLFAAYGITARLFVARHKLGHLFPKLIAIACGGEFVLLGIQKFVIGHWCPLCNVIAGTVFIVGTVFVTDWVKQLGCRLFQENVSRLKFVLTCLVQIFVVIGFVSSGIIGAFIGVQGPSKKTHAGISRYQGASSPSVGDNEPQTTSRPTIEYIGKQNSTVEIYIITDWFCPACKKVEREIKNGLPGLLGEAKIAFIDLPIHDESLNYIPYNLSLLASNKDRYMEGRSVLVELSEKTDRPSLAEVQNAMGAKGIDIKVIGLNSVNDGINGFRQVAEALGVNVTPTVVVRNSAMKKRQTLVGGRQVNMLNIKEAIKSVSNES